MFKMGLKKLLVFHNSRYRPDYSSASILNTRSNSICIRGGEISLGERSSTKLRDYKIMVGIYQGILVPTIDEGEGFRMSRVRVQQAVQVGIRRAMAEKVMLCFVFDIELTESVVIANLIQQVCTVLVGFADIESTTKIDLGIKICIFKIIDTAIQLGKFVEEVRLSPERW